MSKEVLICIIDDDEIHKYTFSKALKEVELPHRLQMFSDGEEALEFMVDNIENPQHIPDIIFLDINMPITDGFEFMEEYGKIKSRMDKQITTYVVSSSLNPADLERARSMDDITDYIVKPLEAGKLSKLLGELNQNSDLEY